MKNLLATMLLALPLPAQLLGALHAGCTGCAETCSQSGTGVINTTVTTTVSFLGSYTASSVFVSMALSPTTPFAWPFGTCTQVTTCGACDFCTVFIDLSTVFNSGTATFAFTNTFTHTWVIPNNSVLIGTPVYTQSSIIDSSNTWHISNSWEFVIS